MIIKKWNLMHSISSKFVVTYFPARIMYPYRDNAMADFTSTMQGFRILACRYRN